MALGYPLAMPPQWRGGMMLGMRSLLAIFLLVVHSWAIAGEATIAVRLPDGEQVAVEAGKPADVKLKDGTRLVGVDMSWYAKSKPAGEPLADDDRKSIEEILTVPSFYNKSRLLYLQGDAQRAVGLVELVRDTDFYAGKGQVVWRVELWYFEFENGGWAKVSQQNKLLDRQRFADHDAYQKYVAAVRYVPRLGSIAATTHSTVIVLREQDIVRISK